MEPSRAVSLALLLICIILSVMRHDALRNCNSGAMIIFRSNGVTSISSAYQARTKLSLLLLHEVLIAHTKEELQSILNDCMRVASCYVLTISLTKTEVMLQPKLGSSPRDPVIKIGDKQLKVQLLERLSLTECWHRIPQLVKQVPALDGCTTDCG